MLKYISCKIKYYKNCTKQCFECTFCPPPPYKSPEEITIDFFTRKITFCMLSDAKRVVLVVKISERLRTDVVQGCRSQ